MQPNFLEHIKKAFLTADNETNANPVKDKFSDESLLVRRLKQNHLPAFKYLYDHYAGALYTIIITILDNEELSAKAFYETFLQIRSKIHCYNFNPSLFTWMHNIARHCAIDVAKKHFTNSTNSDGNKPPANTGISNLKKIINNLPVDLKEIMEMRYYKNNTVEQIALKLNLQTIFVKEKLRAALILMHKSISGK